MKKLEILSKNFGLGINSLKEEYSALAGLKLAMITPSMYGSGVSELAGGLLAYFKELGINCSWDKINASEEFFVLSKKISNAMALSLNEISNLELDHFKEFSLALTLPADTDILYLHDFHALIAASKIKNVKKIYRCHYDISRANSLVWNFFKPYIEACDSVIFTSPSCHRPLECKVDYILPSIDPCSVKNTFVDRKGQLEVLKKFGIPANKPIILQVSRFDRVKDPFGLIDIFKEVRKTEDCVLVYAGGLAPDDVNAAALYAELKKYTADCPDIKLLCIDKMDYEIAALQSAAQIIVQKSFSESFGLAITEALWKAKPVIASDVGGIRYQIINNKTGLLCSDDKAFISSIKRLLAEKSLSERLSASGREFVKERFLITRELKNHSEIFKKIV